jgi:hypothetical protein
MSTLAILKGARALITEPSAWSQIYLARGADGNPTEPTSPNARCFCALGAIECLKLIDGSYGSGSYASAVGALREAIGPCLSVSVFNDTHTHAEVLAAFDRAIARLEGAA